MEWSEHKFAGRTYPAAHSNIMYEAGLIHALTYSCLWHS